MRLDAPKARPSWAILRGIGRDLEARLMQAGQMPPLPRLP